ncbi:MAG: ribose ABC transporter permease RbsC [Spirochaetales bacterium]
MILKKIQPVFWVILILMLVFNFFSSRFLSLHNIVNLFQQGAVLLVVAAAATLVILSEGLDLSLGSVLTLSGITCVLSLNSGVPVGLAILIGVLTGFVCGAITGALIAVFNMQPFIATLGIQGVYYGFSLVLTDSVAVLTKNETFIFFGSRIGYIPMAAIIGGGAFLIILYLFHNTPFGRYVVAIGGNEAGTRLSGVNTTFWKWFTYAFAGGVTGFAGVLLAARLEAADPIVGVGWEFDAIAATILGGTSFQKGKGGVKGTALGVLLITVVRNGLNVVRTPSILQPALIGTILILAIVIQVGLSMRAIRKEGANRS